VFGAEIVIAYVVAWVVRKARRAGQRLDSEADAAMDAGLDRLHELIATKLGSDPALARLEAEAQGGQVGERTQLRLRLALEDARDDDQEFAAGVQDVLGQLDQARADGATLVTITQSATGDQNVQLTGVQGTVSISFGGTPGKSPS